MHTAPDGQPWSAFASASLVSAAEALAAIPPTAVADRAAVATAHIAARRIVFLAIVLTPHRGVRVAGPPYDSGGAPIRPEGRYSRPAALVKSLRRSRSERPVFRNGRFRFSAHCPARECRNRLGAAGRSSGWSPPEFTRHPPSRAPNLGPMTFTVLGTAAGMREGLTAPPGDREGR